ncbi:DNA polymerase III subunit alpha [Streptomyces sp. NBC_01264]|uniref:DNA polymerase III subunit alpha n=1 Tax=Streptomyces sp. NBC_01264 TaxID=2903804 RepID=UPI0022529D53|nr:DNA polymerase III subunit alpha [Streptomyces sp. NBC_01264]MCX4783939.1 DNA polymerase III subunit alpha [Streptomyces sp. NBC_01264]
MEGFAHLHVASGYSARYGASAPDQLVEAAASRGMHALALTDRDTVTGFTRFAKACEKHGVRPILGADVAVASLVASRDERRRVPARGGAHVREPNLRVQLLAQNRTGWTRLCRLLSTAHAEPADGFPVVSWSSLREHAGQDLTVLLGPNSEPVRALTAGRPDLAEQLLRPWREDVGAGLRLAALWHGQSGTGPGSLRLAARTVGLADRLGIPAVLTNAVRYAHPGQHRLADVLDAARLLRPIDRRRLDSGERWLKGPQEMTAAAEQIALAAGAGPRRARQLLAQTEAAAQQCTLDPRADLGLGRPHLPEPQTAGAADAADAARVLRERCEAGLIRRGLDRSEDARHRLDHELAIIRRLEYDTYFLTVAQVVDDVRELGIRVAARGSGAGSMTNHLLGIAAANPLDHHLVFERFLSLRRTDLPDIDLDVEADRRLEVYDKIFERYGTGRVAVAAMPETYRARHALRDTGLALGIAPGEIDRVAKSFPHIRACDIRSALHELPELKPLAAQQHRYGALFELAEGLDALPRGIAMHPCGVVISDASLRTRLPVQPTPGRGFDMLMADKEDIEDLGLIKLDVLGVRMQSSMAHAVHEIKRTTGQDLDLDTVPLDDYFSFKLLMDSDTIGLFQLESPGQMDLLGRLQPRNVQDVIADISLFRPGPVAGGMPAQYIAARHGEPPVYPHPDLEPILSDTHGVLIWHEQIIKIIARLTGCDDALAELARRALGDAERALRVRDWFRRAGRSRGYDDTMLAQVWEQLQAFGAYGFCRAHAVAFAVPALQSAYLKAHFPAALYAGLLQHDPGMWEKRIIVADARRHGIEVRNVDVNHSAAAHRVEPAGDGTWAVRLSLAEVRGITDEQTERIVAGQPYASLQDLWQRARPARPVAEHLVNIGALDTLRGTASRRDLLLQVAELHRQTRGRPVGDGQLPLDHDTFAAAPSGLPEMTSRERLSAELDVLAIDVSQHLMEHHHQLLRELGVTSARRLHTLRPGQPVLVAGVRAATQTPPIPSGKRIIFTSLDDGSGLVDVAFFDSSHERAARTVFHSALLLVRGKVQRRGQRASVVAEMAWDLEALAVTRRDHGPDAVHQLLGRTAAAATPSPPPRVLELPNGAKLHAWADLAPAGDRTANLRAYASPGSAG